MNMMDGIMAAPGTICSIRRGTVFSKTTSQTNGKITDDKRGVLELIPNFVVF